MAQTGARTQLETQGYVVVPVFGGTDLRDIRRRFLSMLAELPGYKRREGREARYHPGGFSALGCAGSFHHPLARELRRMIWDLVRRMGYGEVTALFDRLMARPADKAPTAESMHRDQNPYLREHMSVLGGWTNLNGTDDFASLVPGSHLEGRGPAGFAKIPKEMVAAYKARRELVRIPPGHAIFFWQDIVHEVLSKTYDHARYRIFHGVAVREVPLAFRQMARAAADHQAVPLLPSGQAPPMYAVLHWVNMRDQLAAFAAEHLDPAMTEERTLRSAEPGQQATFRVPARIAPSLEELRAMYPAYSEEDLAVLGLVGVEPNLTALTKAHLDEAPFSQRAIRAHQAARESRTGAAAGSGAAEEEQVTRRRRLEPTKREEPRREAVRGKERDEEREEEGEWLFEEPSEQETRRRRV